MPAYLESVITCGLTTMKKVDPQQQLESLIERVRKAGQNLLSFTTTDATYITRDKGLYAYLLAKPSRRLAGALSVDRELLILISPFENQQQRTIKTAREIISNSEGRLEPTVAIIFHNDPDGNIKLQKWGRSAGLAILPVYAKRMPSTDEELEHHLCHELFSHDPFDVTGPVSDDENFFGRRNEALDLARKLQIGQIRSCLGIRKIGKTSVMNRVIAESRRSHDCYCIMLDCSRDQIWSLTSAGLLNAIADATKEAIASPDRYATVVAPRVLTAVGDAAATLQVAVSIADKPVLIFIDEVDYITPASPTTAGWAEYFNEFWRNFRAVYQESLRREKKLSVMVGGVSSKWFAVGSIGGVENAALAFIPDEYLSPLPRGATVAMIKKISRTAGLVFTDETAGLIAAACSDMPFWVRKACSFIHLNIDVAQRPVTLDSSNVTDLINRFIDQEGATLAQVAVAHLFRVYPELEGPALLGLADPPQGIAAGQITVLKKYGVFAQDGPVRPSGEMITQALRLYKEERESGQESAQLPLSIATDVKDKRALEDWADDLAVINKGRNILEKNLRHLALNFLRADALANKRRGTTRDRVLATMPPERKARLNHLPADEAIEQLLWSELVALIGREWSLFSAVFGDRKQFEAHAWLINERYDAHAKDADALDLANYRRSLKWLGDRLAAI